MENKQVIDINELTIGQVKQLASLASCMGVSVNEHPVTAGGRRIPIAIGSKVFVRTVTHHYTGMVVACTDEELQIKNAAWIADDGRFGTSIKAFEFSEVEPYPDELHPILNRGSFIDCVVVPDGYQLPRSQK